MAKGERESPPIDWDDPKNIAKITELWGLGHSTAEIGREMGISKNAAGGKVHRLNLPPRPSPIRRGGTSAPPKIRRVAGPTLPRIVSVEVKDEEPPKPVVLAKPTEVRTVEPPKLRPAPSMPRNLRTVCCQWPIGEPGTPFFRFCDADATSGKPYCADHAAVAYVKVVDYRRDNIA
jgi:GcrA cell cycle regulator